MYYLKHTCVSKYICMYVHANMNKKRVCMMKWTYSEEHFYICSCASLLVSAGGTVASCVEQPVTGGRGGRGRVEGGREGGREEGREGGREEGREGGREERE